MLTLFHMLPEAMAAYISEWLQGFTARSATRPEAQAGPTDLNEIALKKEDGTAGLTWLPDDFASFLVSFFCAHRLHEPASNKTIINVRILFIRADLVS